MTRGCFRTAVRQVLLAGCVFLCLYVKAQTTGPDQKAPAPEGGVEALALEYYKIDFTKAQRKRLKNVEIEFIYRIDEQGNPDLVDINGLTDRDLLDSLRSQTPKLPRFSPMLQGGIPAASIYTMLLVFPSYKQDVNQIATVSSLAYRKIKIEDFESIHKSGQRMDMILGGMLNQFTGNPARHLATGGGMKIDLLFTARNRLAYGLNMNIYGNQLKREYPLQITRKQLPAPPTLLVGASFGRSFGYADVHLQVSLAVQNITQNQGDSDPEWVQLKGWSPGLVVNFPIRLGKETFYDYYGSPSLFSNNLNFHLGLRPVFLSLREASGGMLEAGISYRMSFHMVDEYRLKPR